MPGRKLDYGVYTDFMLFSVENRESVNSKRSFFNVSHGRDVYKTEHRNEQFCCLVLMFILVRWCVLSSYVHMLGLVLDCLLKEWQCIEHNTI